VSLRPAGERDARGRRARRRPRPVGTRPVLRVLLAAMLMVPALVPAQVTWSDLAPVVQERCVLCHSGESAPLGLRLDSLAGLLAGSRNGPVVVAGDPAGSELVRRLAGDSQPRMPMTGPPFLAAEAVARFEAWIAAGMPAGAPAAPGETAGAGPVAIPAPGAAVTWAHVAPLFARRCAKCHTDNGLMGPAPESLRLDGYAGALDARERARVVPGHPRASELVRRVRGQSLPRMPFDGPPWLTAEEVALIERWVSAGAPDAEGRPAPYPEGARVRLGGTLRGRASLDGLTIVIHGGTRVDRGLRDGDRVQVRGRLGADGQVRAERVRSR